MTDRKTSQTDKALADWWKRGARRESEDPLTVTPEPAREVALEGTTPMRGVVAIFSESRKEGRWLVPRRVRVLSVFGNAKVDLREAVLQYQETVIEAIGVLADIQIIVPPNLVVEIDGDALLGSFTVNESKKRGARSAQPSPGAPIVRVIGSATLASVTVKIRPLR